MEVVINKCHGGFGVSALALKRICDLKNIPCYFFVQKVEDNFIGYYSATVEEADSALFYSAFTVPNPDEYIGRDREYNEMTDEERTERNKRYHETCIERGCDMDRCDPILVQVVKELGEKANGSCAELSVVEIPDGIEWQIDEYDGKEWVAEKHRTWY